MVIIDIHFLHFYKRLTHCSAICSPVMISLMKYWMFEELLNKSYISKAQRGTSPASRSINLPVIRVSISRGSLARWSWSDDPLGIINGSPDLSRSSRLLIVSSYLMGMREERSVVLYPSVSIFPKTIHFRITIFLIRNPGLWIHLPSLLFGMSSVDRKISEIMLY